MANPNPLTINTSTSIPSASAGEAIAVFIFQDDLPIDDHKYTELITRCVSDGEFKGEADTSSLFYATEQDGNVRRLLLIGCGKRDEQTPAVLIRAAGMAAREASSAHIKRLHLLIPPGDEEVTTAYAMVVGAVIGSYNGSFYQHDDEDETHLEHLTLIVSSESDDISGAVERGRIIGEATNWTRTLADTPGRDLPPEEFSKRAAAMAEEFGLEVESLGVEELKHRGMGGILGVGKGSEEPPALIVLRYEPNVATSGNLWAFVGKGITFDTGGISLKHGLDMYEMKADMAGGAAVLGAMRAIAQLKPNQRVVGIVPAAENMPSGRSIKPGDIIKTFAGQTIEVVDTDAEGRLVLVDGIAYAKQLGATRIIDLATLTGSIIVALGDHRAGLFSNNDELTDRVIAASQCVGEPVWRMPVNDDYKKRIESDIADFKNYGGRPDATGAALLLSKFAGDTPWVHLDIAATAWYDDPQPHAPKGSSGAGVRTLVDLICHHADRLESGDSSPL